MYFLFVNHNYSFNDFYFSGRCDLNVVSHHKCAVCNINVPFNNSNADIIKSGFWPGTPTAVSHIYSNNMLEGRLFQLE